MSAKALMAGPPVRRVGKHTTVPALQAALADMERQMQVMWLDYQIAREQNQRQSAEIIRYGDILADLRTENRHLRARLVASEAM